MPGGQINFTSRTWFRTWRTAKQDGIKVKFVKADEIRSKLIVAAITNSLLVFAGSFALGLFVPFWDAVLIGFTIVYLATHWFPRFWQWRNLVRKFEGNGTASHVLLIRAAKGKGSSSNLIDYLTRYCDAKLVVETAISTDNKVLVTSTREILRSERTEFIEPAKRPAFDQNELLEGVTKAWNDLAKLIQVEKATDKNTLSDLLSNPVTAATQFANLVAYRSEQISQADYVARLMMLYRNLALLQIYFTKPIEDQSESDIEDVGIETAKLFDCPLDLERHTTKKLETLPQHLTSDALSVGSKLHVRTVRMTP